MVSKEKDPAFEAFFQRLRETSASQRLPDLFRNPPADALYHLRDREGVSVVAVRTTSLSHEQLLQIMGYRLAQYLALDYLNFDKVYEARAEHEPLANVAANDLHVISGAAESGEILCYCVFETPPDAPHDATLRTRERGLFALEKIFGWGVFNRLSIVPDMPIARIREIGRFVKNQHREALDDLSARGPIELIVAVQHLVRGPLASDVEACLIDIEERVKTRKVLDFFHLPIALLHGVVPYVCQDHWSLPSYQSQVRYPAAFLCSDSSQPRLAAIEEALAQPGKQGLAALWSLKSDPNLGRCSLAPPEGLAPLSDASVPQEGVAMEARRMILDIGEWLRSTPIFKGLSVAEAAVLATSLERRTAAAGDVLMRQGEAGDDLFLIETGRVRVEVAADGQHATIATLGPGDYFGEIALVAGGTRAADVIAVEPLTLLRLSREAYTRYLLQEAEVDRELTHTALSRSRELMQQMSTRAPGTITNEPPRSEINTERPKGYVSADYLQMMASVVRHIKARSYALMRLGPGSRVLDVGCGPASDTIAMAAVVGSGGEVIGIDYDQAMVEQAQRYTAQAQVDAWVNHRRADCTALPFESGYFDACHGERVLEHVRDSERALSEMIRVTRNNGWIVVIDTDWGSCSIDTAEVDIERRLARARAERQINNGYSGRQLYRQFKQAGLTDLEIEVSAFFATDYAFARQVLMLDATENVALSAGVVTEDEIQRWRASLERSADAGTFFAVLTLVTVAGRKP